MTGVVGPLATFFLRLFYSPGSNTDLALISDVVRFILTWLGPFFPFGRSFLGWISVRSGGTFTDPFHHIPIADSREEQPLC